MLRAGFENKYSFNMQVSAEAMDRLDRAACAWDALLWATTFDECIQSVRYPAPSVRRPLIEIVYPIEKHSEHKPAFAFEDLSPVQTSGVRRINVVRLSGPAIGLRYAPILRSIFESDTSLLQWCAAQ